MAAAVETDGYILALDSGTTSVRALLFDRSGHVAARAAQPITQHYPRPGWVEHDAREILAKQVSVISEIQFASGIHSDRIVAVGIANQRETVVVWDRHTGDPVCNAICWQCRRTEPLVTDLAARGLASMVAEKTGLVLDPYFSASKVAWILGNVPGARARAEAGDLLFGTIDSWLVWNLTGGASHCTDRTNASRTMLYNIHDLSWDDKLLELFAIPRSLLPEVLPSVAPYGHVTSDILASRPPIFGVAGDQQASLFGHGCLSAGEVKATYGTGCFILMNTGSTAVASTNGLITTMAATPDESVAYALEGSVFNAGSTVQWLRDGLGLIGDVAETEALASSVSSSEGVYLVPAFTGLGAPWWDAGARGLLCGLTRGTTRAHIARAALEGVAFQVCDVVDAMCHDAETRLGRLAVDGGMASNNFAMQCQADLLACRVVRPSNTEATARGAAYLAGLGVGYWADAANLLALQGAADSFEPVLLEKERLDKLRGWHEALGMCSASCRMNVPSAI